MGGEAFPQTTADPVLPSHALTGKGKPEELIMLLQVYQRKNGYISEESTAEIAQFLQCSESHVYGVASFYQMFSTKPQGTHVVKFCESAPCHVIGGRQVWEALQRELQLKTGETSPDGKWTLVTVSCLGVCAVGPVIVIDDDMYGNVEPDQIAGILARYA